jgi:ribose transport system substrate-binding protein
MQSQEILKLLQSPAQARPHGILFEPVGTALAKPAQLAATENVGWVILNRANVDYLPELRRAHGTPMFCVTASHTDVGSVQGEQMRRLVRSAGIALYIQGPSDNEASKQRTAGMQASKPPLLEIRFMTGAWTEISGYRAIQSFLALSTSRQAPVKLVAAQNDAMALGARRAFQELTSGADLHRFLDLPFIGCDGLPDGGQAAVRKGDLAATVVIPPNAGRAVEVLADALRTRKQPEERLLTTPTSFPALSSLVPRVSLSKSGVAG